MINIYLLGAAGVALALLAAYIWASRRSVSVDPAVMNRVGAFQILSRLNGECSLSPRELADVLTQATNRCRFTWSARLTSQRAEAAIRRRIERKNDVQLLGDLTKAFQWSPEASAQPQPAR